MSKKHETFNPADRKAISLSTISASLAESPEMRFDSEDDASVYFARELDHVKTKTYDKVYPEMSAFHLFPITHEVPAGAETVTYYGYEKKGMAKIINNYATDLPRVDIKGEAKTAQVKGLGSSYGYSVQDMRAARMKGMNLEARKGEAARYAVDTLANAILWKGDPANNLVGVLSEDNDIPVYTPAQNSSHKTVWAEKTADEIVADVAGMIKQVKAATKNREHPNRLVLPSVTYSEISLKRIPDTNISILKYLQDNLKVQGIEVMSSADLDAGATDTNPYANDSPDEGKGVALLYTYDPDKLAGEIPMPFYQHPAQYKNLEIEVPCESRIAGAMIYYPLSAIIAVGV